MLSDDTKEKLLKQLEFYFSDSNLPRDKFLRGKTQEDAEGYVDLELVCSFTRISKLLGHDRQTENNPVPAHEVQQVAEILQSGSQQLVVSADGKRVKRATAPASLDEAARQADERSLYVTPLPYNANLDDLTAFFKQEAPVNAVRLRRHISSKDFRGSIFVEFNTREDADKVAAKQLKYEGAPLRMLPKLLFVQQKIDARHAKAQANGHAPPTAAAAAPPPAQAAAAASVTAAAQPAVPALVRAAAAAGPSSTAAPAAAIPSGTEEHKRQADGDVEGPAAKRARSEAIDSLEKADWLEELNTVAKFNFREASKVPQAAGLQMLRDSFGGPKAGLRNLNYLQGHAEGHVRFNSEAELDAALTQLATEEDHVLLAGFPATVFKNTAAMEVN
ncbi:hypothetical protein WJX74_005063 [Apatococcus lobatus]|uniref:Uncharacterized protein n=1 Tax=Apatococcus lobatus TaxID=904363 RepID=A0AAW1S565_9CHLO